MTYTTDKNYENGNGSDNKGSDNCEPSLLEKAVNEASADNSGRRDFLKKLTYIPPLIVTFNLAETTYGTETEGDDESQGRSRGRRRISPAPGRGRGRTDDYGSGNNDNNGNNGSGGEGN